MAGEVLLDAGVVTRCRRRVHLDHDPTMRGAQLAPPDPAAEQRIADAREHRARIAEWLRAETPGSWAVIPGELPAAERERLTRAALDDGVAYIWNGLLPVDVDGGRRGGVQLLVRASDGYVPVLVVRHRITDPGEGAWTTVLPQVDPDRAAVDTRRKVRSHPRDQLRLAHARRLLEAAGYAESDRTIGGVVGLDADVVVWHDLSASTWPGGRNALQEYDERFADRLAVARAAARRGEALAKPSRILECKRCPWWPVCESELVRDRDVSLVVRGEDAVELRNVGMSTVDKLAALDPEGESPIQWTGTTFADAVALARAWLADLTVVRRVETVRVPRADVEVDIDMESFGDLGAYLWGCLLSGADIGIEPGYRAFVTWDPLPTDDEARSFARFWTWLSEVRAKTEAAGLTFRAYCYNALAENRWLYASAERFAGMDGIPTRQQVRRFVESDEWVDLFRSVSDQFLCSRGKGLKVVAPVAGFSWRDPEASGEASMRWYRDAVGMDGGAPDLAQRERLLRYNEDDVRATYALRAWMSDEAMHAVPFMGEL
ncbi:TM0106 family RecB-like putative nuclease [Saccharomonospora viridis]|jgi:predicted RecB family nuclease|uniref:Predicted nuclease (RecB family) n=2 Tax=Saccharomonospora viridis TaxID=1852 RepID=C7MRU5_SACVD|nr:TM0106 family RecB-like putative nuclease [Saccharomonospora viridis]ACU95157.1 predicted nuclease (RecB family) [Saccharomonospora viridis DSM 43017]KHF44789.1 recombinase RecB [Saccharomonospora viridis]SFP20560.1 RecB family nuclease, putative, TM0106 family [Saccharomonospora viridis]